MPAAPQPAPGAAPVAPRVRIQSFEEILQQVRAGALPTCMPAVPGSAAPSGLRLPARPLYEVTGRGPPSWAQRGEACPVASAEVLRDAREEARRSEEEAARQRACRSGTAGARTSGIIPKGPPSLPMGTMVIEQKFVDFIIGPGGQSLAALNYAAGVNVHLDQSRKFSGYTVANIYGPEDCARRAKVALEFKISQWLPRGAPGAGPRGMTYASAAPIGANTPAPGPAHSAAPSASAAAAAAASAPGSGPAHNAQQRPLGASSERAGATGAGADAASPGGDDAELPPEAFDDPLVQSLAKWPSLARSAARSVAARSSATGAGAVATAVTGGVL